MAEPEKDKEKKEKLNRREFLLKGGSALAGAAVFAGIPAVSGASESKSKQDETAAKSSQSKTDNDGESYPESEAYIVWDSRVCWGCQSCMLVCSAAHYGEANPSLSRIQIIRDAPSFTKYPNDVVMSICRQCVTPLCVQNCPVGAAHIDKEHGNVRVIDQKECIGCKTCIESCPQRPHRTVWNPFIKKSSKCDLCLDTPYWDRKGGPGGEPACVTICPSKALKLSDKTPSQEDIDGYDVDLAPSSQRMRR